MDLKREDPVQLPRKFTVKEDLSTPKNVSKPQLVGNISEAKPNTCLHGYLMSGSVF